MVINAIRTEKEALTIEVGRQRDNFDAATRDSKGSSSSSGRSSEQE